MLSSGLFPGVCILCADVSEHCRFHLHRQVVVSSHNNLPTKMEQCSETLAHKIQTPRNNPEESIQHLEHGESLKSRILCIVG